MVSEDISASDGDFVQEGIEKKKAGQNLDKKMLFDYNLFTKRISDRTLLQVSQIIINWGQPGRERRVILRSIIRHFSFLGFVCLAKVYDVVDQWSEWRRLNHEYEWGAPT